MRPWSLLLAGLSATGSLTALACGAPTSRYAPPFGTSASTTGSGAGAGGGVAGGPGCGGAGGANPIPWQYVGPLRGEAMAIGFLNGWLVAVGGSLYDLASGSPGITGIPRFSLADGSASTLQVALANTGAHSMGAACVIGTRLMLLGGGGDGIIDQWDNVRWDVLDVAKGAWLAGGMQPWSEHAIAAATDGHRCYVAGGNTTRDSLGSTQAYALDPGSGAWSALPALSAPTTDLAAAAEGAVLLIAGGLCNGDPTCPPHPESGVPYGLLDRVQTLDLTHANAPWKDAPSLPRALRSVHAVALHGRFYLFGGDTSLMPPSTLVPEVVSWAPGDSAWRAEGLTPEGRTGGVPFVFGDAIAFVTPSCGGPDAELYRWRP